MGITIAGMFFFLGTAPLAASPRETATVKALQKSVLAVVNIEGEKVEDYAFSKVGENGKAYNGMGTGVIIDSRGYIITNYHVVEGVRQIKVMTHDESTYDAKLVVRDPATDLAIIKINPTESLPTMVMGSSEDLMLGETVLAIGNPYGYPFTVTRGIISSLHRKVEVNETLEYDNVIQIDAAINPGNSGGPLLNIEGKMIGINAAIRQGAVCIAFAIPVDRVMEIAARLMEETTSQYCYHGLQLKPSTRNEENGDSLLYLDRSGHSLVVDSVEPGSPAEEAGIEPGDVLVDIEENAVDRELDFHRSILGHQANEQIALTVLRRSEKKQLSLILRDPRRQTIATTSGSTAWSNTSRETNYPRAATFADKAWETLGLRFEPIDKEEFRRNYSRFARNYPGGMTISAVRTNSLAYSKGLRAGDVLVGIHKWTTASERDTQWIIDRWQQLSELQEVQFLVIRNQNIYYQHIPVLAESHAETLQ